jgi:hypothetical protein
MFREGNMWNEYSGRPAGNRVSDREAIEMIANLVYKFDMSGKKHQKLSNGSRLKNSLDLISKIREVCVVSGHYEIP